MKEAIIRIQNKLNDGQYILLAVISSLVIERGLQIFIDIYESRWGNINQPDLGSNVYRILYSCIVGPFIESILIIFLIDILKKIFKIKTNMCIILASTMFFSCMHCYSIIYPILIFPSAFIIIYSYIGYRPKKLTPFLVMLLVHIIKNSLVVLINLL